DYYCQVWDISDHVLF
nr:immunoglobulin light chain junction region [Macaca mulatta]